MSTSKAKKIIVDFIAFLILIATVIAIPIVLVYSSGCVNHEQPYDLKQEDIMPSSDYIIITKSERLSDFGILYTLTVQSTNKQDPVRTTLYVDKEEFDSSSVGDHYNSKKKVTPCQSPMK